LVGALAQEIMDMSKITNCTVDSMIDRPKPLDEDTGHRHAELGALFSIAANLPIEALEVNPFACFHHRAIQHSRQFFVGHPNLRHGYPLEDFDTIGYPRPRLAILDPNNLRLG
jgi:hypothetical protein